MTATRTRADVLLWAKRVTAKRAADPHVLLEIAADATNEVAQQAFHDIARTSHPDLHRTTCTAEELETITSAFALIASAYQQFRAQRQKTTKIAAIPRALGDVGPAPTGAAARAAAAQAQMVARTARPANVMLGSAPATASDAAVLMPESATSTPNPATTQMTPRGAVHYRKAELALRRGDLASGLLNMKMAIAADPTSKFLRQALAQIESELASKKP